MRVQAPPAPDGLCLHNSTAFLFLNTTRSGQAAVAECANVARTGRRGAEKPDLRHRRLLRTQRASNLFQTASASRVRFVIVSGCEISARWLASISIVFAPIRLAMKRSRSGLIVRSWVDTA
jgi:hypothetical protein